MKIKLNESKLKVLDMNDEIEVQNDGDSAADAIAAVMLTAVFVATCIFWISSQ